MNKIQCSLFGFHEERIIKTNRNINFFKVKIKNNKGNYKIKLKTKV